MSSVVSGTTPQSENAPHIHELIQHRWSPRAFSSKEISPQDLTSILEAARWAASSYNEQPWRFLVATKAEPEAYGKLLDLLVPFNQTWARSAPVLLLAVAKTEFSHNDTPNQHAFHDIGAALAQAAIQAAALGIQVHGMAGFDAQKAVATLGIPAGYVPVTAAALGYVGSPDDLPEVYREREKAPRQRKPLSEIVFGADWNTKAPI